MNFRNFIPIDLQIFGGGSLPELIQRLINIALLLAGVVAVIFLIIGGYSYITAGGNAEQAAGAKTTVLNAIIGLIIIFASFLIINFVISRIA
jgi:TRAP-type C4-dicarboxylate transport system permease small subunit